MFYVDKYIPKNINEIFFHEKIYELLKIMANDDSIPHLLFHGPYGCGKKTMVNIFLQLLFGDTINTIKNVYYNVSGSGNTTTVEEFMQSYHHIFIEPKGNNHDRYLIHDVIKVYVGRATYNIIKSKHNFKVVVINNVDIMSESVQFSLRRTIEQYSDQCRFIIISNSISKVIDPLASRCLCINVKSPDINYIIDYSFYIAKKESLILSLDRLSYICIKYNGNIKNVLWILQIFKINDQYINNIEDSLNNIKTLFQKINVNFDYSKYINEIKYYNQNNNFIYKNTNKYSNKIGNEIYDFILENIKKYISIENYNKYYSTPYNFVNKITKTNFKTIKYQNIEKKVKLDELLFKIKNNFYELLVHIKLLSPILTSENAIKKIYRYIKLCNLKNINIVRDIIFNLLITNISGTKIIKLILQEIIDDDKLLQYKKIKIINICKDAEYGIIKGRREINQFDNLIVSIVNIILS